jgi:hypothetical protein
MELEITDLEPIDIKLDTSSSTNFGGGIELLMNDKNKSSTKTTNIDLGDLDKLEEDLNDLSNIKINSAPSPSLGVTFDDFSKPGPMNVEKINVQLEAGDSKVGSSTMGAVGNTSTWDGFMKTNETPHSYDKPIVSLNERDKKRKKRQMLKSLDHWAQKGLIKEATRLNIDSNYEDIEDEFESAVEDKRKKDSVKIQQNWMITMINTIEYGNAMFDPFGISLDGWGESVSEDIDSYDEIFGELHEKYKGGKMSPELSLLLRLGFSASVVHFSNKALSTAAPGFNDVIKQSPELMKMFTNATVDTMKQQTPGMAFAEELMKNKPNMSHGPPPAGVETREQSPPQRPGSMNFTERPTNRPDLNKNTMFAESGVDMNNNSAPLKRAEMSGPKNTDVDSILSGLKPKASAPPPTLNEVNSKPVNIDMYKTGADEDSLISVSSLKDLEGNVKPKKSKRRNTSDKKVVSLDI